MNICMQILEKRNNRIYLQPALNTKRLYRKFLSNILTYEYKCLYSNRKDNLEEGPPIAINYLPNVIKISKGIKFLKKSDANYHTSLFSDINRKCAIKSKATHSNWILRMRN